MFSIDFTEQRLFPAERAEYAETSVQVLGSKLVSSFCDFCVFCGRFGFYGGLSILRPVLTLLNKGFSPQNARNTRKLQYRFWVLNWFLSSAISAYSAGDSVFTVDSVFCVQWSADIPPTID
ncbi:MAG: hypothetical protein COZ05_03845 [Armatimonadetes bacterium CG_4_10_14_3_um_filter_59_10]|nr:MAG: hypothetical protein COZ05_03845 [Armatimonadetes bacterium CG_4_10_14_3_um_filter_59_10]